MLNFCAKIGLSDFRTSSLFYIEHYKLFILRAAYSFDQIEALKLYTQKAGFMRIYTEID